MREVDFTATASKLQSLLVVPCVLLVLAHCRPALACGTWNLDDIETDRSVNFLCRTVTVKNKGKKTYFTISGNTPPTLFVKQGKPKEKTLFIKDHAVHKGDRVVARFTENTLELGGNTYRFSATRTKRSCNWYKVVIESGNQVVAKSNKAYGFYDSRRDDPKLSAPQSDCVDAKGISPLHDVRNRVWLYLVWRNLVDHTPLTKSNPAAPAK